TSALRNALSLKADRNCAANSGPKRREASTASVSEFLGDAAVNGATRPKGRHEGADRRAAAQQIDLVEQVDHVEAELDRADAEQPQRLREAEIDLGVGR